MRRFILIVVWAVLFLTAGSTLSFAAEKKNASPISTPSPESITSMEMPLQDSASSGFTSFVLWISLTLFILAGFLLFYFWQLDRERRLRRARIKLMPPEEYLKFTLQDSESFVDRTPGSHADEPDPDPIRPLIRLSAPEPHSISGRVRMAIEQDEELEMAEKIAIQKLAEEFEKLEQRMSLLSEGIVKVNSRLDQIARHGISIPGMEALEMQSRMLEARLKEVENNNVPARPVESRVIMDHAVLKKFNELELLISQSLSEMGRMIDEFSRRINKVEAKVTDR